MVLWTLKYDSMFVEEVTKEGTRAPYRLMHMMAECCKVTKVLHMEKS